MRTLGIWLILTILSLSFALRNPYEILGVKSSATITEIKKAYKRLAKEWHPDKNSDSSAPTKFVEITQAYEVLSDPERRALYDSQGITEDVANSRDRHDHGHFGHFEKFDSFFSRGGFKFEFNFDQSRTFSKQTITSKVYVNSVVPTSAWQPYLILFYSDWCIACLQAEAIWSKISEELEPLGLGIATIHAERDRALAKKIGVMSLPYLILTLDGHPYHYKETQLSFVRVVEFVKKKFPYQMVVTLDIDSADDFLDGWVDNRVRLLIFSRRESIRLRYLLVAYWFLSRAAFGYVHLEKEEGRKLAEKYHVPTNMETLLLFKEDKMMPAATLSMPDMSSTAMKDVINDNKYLILPRLSSQEIFDQLCPPESSLVRKRLCVVLVTQDIPAHEPYRQALRDYLREHPLKNDRARFMYIFADKQKDFLTALTTEDAGFKDIGLVVLWRRNEKTVQYRWLKDGWSMNLERVNISGDVLHTAVITLLHSKDSLSPDAIIKALVDEHVVNIFSRMILKLVTITQCLKDSITRNEILPAVTVLLTIGFIVLGGYFMAYLVKLEEQTIAEKYQREGKDIPGVPKKMIKETPFKVHELRGETYNGLVKLLKPGCRTIVILVDNESKAKLYPIFYRTCFPYRRNKTLMFAFLLLEKNLEWYRRLLIQTLAEPRELNINPKNCIGTVLSLNGHRKYFCMYHAKYRENFRPGAIKKELTGGDFMGFQDTSDSEGETSDIEVGRKMEKLNLIEQRPDDNLLEGFPYWLDRLFEGLTQRYYLQFWPSMK